MKTMTKPLHQRVQEALYEHRETTGGGCTCGKRSFLSGGTFDEHLRDVLTEQATA